MAGKRNGSGQKRRGGGRRSRAESMTGAKENEVEVRTIGDNSDLALPAPDDYAHHMKTIRGCRDRLATASSLLSHAKKSANKCAPGLAASVEETLKIERENDPVKLRTRLEMLGLGLKQIDSSIQLNVFDTLAGDQKEMVARRGYEDGKAARPQSSDYPEGSDLAALYSENWLKGQAEIFNITKAPEESARVAAE